MHWLHSLTGAKKIVDLCAGSGTGMITAVLDGIEWIGAEMCREAVTIAQARHAFWSGLSPEAIELMKKDSATKSIQKQNKIARLENK
jgi:methylase of polypeptide subunit release factors